MVRKAEYRTFVYLFSLPKPLKSMNEQAFSLSGLLAGAAICFFCAQPTYASSDLPYWKDIQTVSVNREAPRSAFMTYADREQAASMKYEQSPYYQLLNGTWKFYYVDSYKQLRVPPAWTDGKISRFPETGKYKASEQPSTPTTATNSSPVIPSRLLCRNRIR